MDAEELYYKLQEHIFDELGIEISEEADDMLADLCQLLIPEEAEVAFGSHDD